MGFVANFILFPVMQNFDNRLRFDKVTESLKVETFLRHSGQRTSICVFIVECDVARFLCAMRLFEVRASFSSPRLPLCQSSFLL